MQVTYDPLFKEAENDPNKNDQSKVTELFLSILTSIPNSEATQFSNAEPTWNFGMVWLTLVCAGIVLLLLCVVIFVYENPKTAKEDRFKSEE